MRKDLHRWTNPRRIPHDSSADWTGIDEFLRYSDEVVLKTIYQSKASNFREAPLHIWRTWMPSFSASKDISKFTSDCFVHQRWRPTTFGRGITQRFVIEGVNVS